MHSSLLSFFKPKGIVVIGTSTAPLPKAEASKMIRKTWARRKLKGFRHLSPADEDSVNDVLINLA